jgi:hypothetical protein
MARSSLQPAVRLLAMFLDFCHWTEVFDPKSPRLDEDAPSELH